MGFPWQRSECARMGDPCFAAVSKPQLCRYPTKNPFTRSFLEKVCGIFMHRVYAPETNCCIYIYIRTPRTPMTSILVVEPPKTRPFPIKTRVIWVLGIYIYFFFCLSECIFSKYLSINDCLFVHIDIHGGPGTGQFHSPVSVQKRLCQSINIIWLASPKKLDCYGGC